MGIPSAADSVLIAQGSLEDASFIAAYGKKGQVVAAVAFNHARWLEFYQQLIEQAAPFPPRFRVLDHPALGAPVPVVSRDPWLPFQEATVVLTGHDPDERRVRWIPRQRAV